MHPATAPEDHHHAQSYAPGLDAMIATLLSASFTPFTTAIALLFGLLALELGLPLVGAVLRADSVDTGFDGLAASARPPRPTAKVPEAASARPENGAAGPAE